MQVTVEVVLPGLPAAVDCVARTHVTVRAEHVAIVDAYRPPASTS